VIREVKGRVWPGGLMIVLLLLMSGIVVWQLVSAIGAALPLTIVLWVLGVVFVAFLWGGFFVVQPNHGKVLQLFGRYAGTTKDAGLWWANPLYSKRGVSLRVRNFETARLDRWRSPSSPRSRSCASMRSARPRW